MLDKVLIYFKYPQNSQLKMMIKVCYFKSDTMGRNQKQNIHKSQSKENSHFVTVHVLEIQKGMEKKLSTVLQSKKFYQKH
jgi:hypothetical protein